MRVRDHLLLRALNEENRSLCLLVKVFAAILRDERVENAILQEDHATMQEAITRAIATRNLHPIKSIELLLDRDFIH